MNLTQSMILFSLFSVAFFPLCTGLHGLDFFPKYKVANKHSIDKRPHLRRATGPVMAITYKPLKLSVPNEDKPKTLLVRSNERSIINHLKSTVHKKEFEDWKELDKWIAEGKAHWLTSDCSMIIAETERKQRRDTAGSKLPSSFLLATDTYVNVSPDRDEPILLKASKANEAHLISQSPAILSELEMKGEAFTNLTKFFEDRRISSRADEIAKRLKQDFDITSPEWMKWTNRTTVYNATSLTQVFGSYFSEHTIGDNGGADNLEDVDYVPRRGYPGTLAPGENFYQDADINDLPKRILHPWPAMQQIPFHVRWPPSHPMIPSTLLWFALNNMFTENFTEWQLNLPSNETVGGWMMEPKDAIRIAKYSKFGMSYKQEDQIAHGGMVFRGGYDLPHYNPSFGPTVSEEEAATPIPPELLPITQRWLDPFFGIEIDVEENLWSVDDKISADMEEEERKKAAIEMLKGFSTKVDLEAENGPLYLGLSEPLPSESIGYHPNQTITNPIALESIKHKKLADVEDLTSTFDDEADVGSVREKEQAARDLKLEKINAALHDSLILGKARTPKALIAYAIETIRDMQAETTRIDRDIATRRGSGRRRQRRMKTSEDGTIEPASFDITKEDEDL